MDEASAGLANAPMGAGALDALLLETGLARHPLEDTNPLAQATAAPPPPQGSIGPGAADKPNMTQTLRPASQDREEVLKFLGRALIIPCDKYRAPVVTLVANEASNLYSLLERQLRAEYLVGAEKFWKIVRLDQHLDTWRPRVHGTQLKALLNCRLPEQPEEYVAAEKAITSIKWALRPDTSPQQFVEELRKFVAGVEVWWDHRNSRRPPASSTTEGGSAASAGVKRPAPAMASPPAAKQQQVQPSQQTVQQIQMAAAQQQAALQAGAAAQAAPPARKQTSIKGEQIVSSSPMYGQAQQQQQQAQQGALMRMHGSFSENGFGSRESPDDLPFGGNGAADLGHFMGAARAGTYPGGPHAPHAPPTDAQSVVSLNVGGHTYTTTAGTLTSVPGSLFWELFNPSGGLQDHPHPPVRLPTGEWFLDRNGKLFSYVLEYLRAASNKEAFSPLPEDANELSALAREAEYYGLSSLVERIRNSAVMPQASTHAVYDSIYLETGFNSIEGPSLKEMEQRKVVVMQQMNHVLAQKAMDGFFVAACDCGVNHREGSDGMQHNLYYHILLKKVMIAPPGLGPASAAMHPHAAAALLYQQQQQHAQAMAQAQAQAQAQQQGGLPGGLPMPVPVPLSMNYDGLAPGQGRRSGGI